MTVSTRLLALLALAAPSCSTIFVGEQEPTPEDAPAETLESAQSGATNEAWREARGNILRTFAFRALEQEQIEEARSYLQEACELDATDTVSHSALARLYLSEGDGRAALVYAERAASVAPDDPQIGLVFAAALAENGEHERATRTLEKVWNDHGEDPEIARALLTHYSASEDEESAHTFVDGLLAKSPGKATTWMLAGDMFLSEGDVDSATDAYGRALELDSSIPTPTVMAELTRPDESDSDPLLHAARSAAEAGDLEGAERLYRFLHTTQSGNELVLAGRASVLWQMERFHECASVLGELTPEARTWRDHLLQAKLDIRGERWSQARAALLLALEDRPGLRAADLLLEYVDQHVDHGEELPDDL